MKTGNGPLLHLGVFLTSYGPLGSQAAYQTLINRISALMNSFSAKTAENNF
jgi:hypothetical protein